VTGQVKLEGFCWLSTFFLSSQVLFGSNQEDIRIALLYTHLAFTKSWGQIISVIHVTCINKVM